MNTNYRLLPQLILLSFCCFFSLFSSQPPLKRFRSSSSCDSQEQAVITPKALVKMAWKEAYSGDFIKARNYLLEAANKGDLLALRYLETSYEQGSLITCIDRVQATKFAELLKSQKYEYHHCVPLDQKIKRKNEYILGQEDARKYAWYRNLESVLKSAFAYRSLKKNKKNFRFPPVEEGLHELLDQYIEKKVDGTFFPLIKQGIQELDSEQLYEQILELASRHYFDASKNHLSLLNLFYPWAIGHGKQKELMERYDDYVSHSNAFGGNYEKKRAKFEAVLALVPNCYQLNYSWAHKLFERVFLECSLKDDRILRLLICIQPIDQLLFDKQTEKLMVVDYLPTMLERALENPVLMKHLNDSTFSVAMIIENAFTEAFKVVFFYEEEQATKAFREFLKKGTSLHGDYLKRICESLQPFLKRHFSYCDEIIDLINSPIPELSKAAFVAIVEHITTIEEQIALPEKRKYLEPRLKRLFSCNLKSLEKAWSATVDDQSSFEFFYQACKTKNALFSLQLFWQYIAQSNDKSDAAFLQKMINEYFGLTICGKNTAEPLNLLLETAIEKAWQQGTIAVDKLRTFLIAANKTGIASGMRFSLLNKIKIEFLKQEDTPLSQRCLFLSDLLTTDLLGRRLAGEEATQAEVLGRATLQVVSERLTKKFKKHMKIKKGEEPSQETCLLAVDLLTAHQEYGYKNIAAQVELLCDPLFKEYAKTVVAIMNPQQSYYDYFCNRKKLMTFCKEHAELPEQISSIKDREVDYCSVIKEIAKEQSSVIHRIVVLIRNPLLVSNQLFGFYEDFEDGIKYRLHAYDAADGFPLWVSPVVQKRSPIAVNNDKVYFMGDNNQLFELDVHDGSIIRKISISIEGEIKKIHVSVDNFLFAFDADQLCIVNLSDLKKNYIKLPLSDYKKNSFFVCDKLIFHCYKKEGECKILTIDKEGKQCEFAEESNIPYNDSNSFVGGNQKMLWYSTNNNEKIVFIDSDSGKKIGEYNFDAHIRCDPILTKKGDRLYILIKTKVVALDISTMPEKSPIEVWSTRIAIEQTGASPLINRILISDNEAIVYGYHCEAGYLLSIDCQTGAKNVLYYLESRCEPYSFLGIYQGLLYFGTVRI